MTPVYQTAGHPRGNCLQAAIASILDLPLEQVPEYSHIEDGTWIDKLATWGKRRGLGLIRVIVPEDKILPSLHNLFMVAVGKTSRGEGEDYHAVVVKATTLHSGEIVSKFVHDPHPSQAMIDDIHQLFTFVKQ